MIRGINRQNIFEYDEDHSRFIEILAETKEISDMKIYAYCLMNNHVHLLLRIESESLGTVMKRIGVRYAVWFNRKYKRTGALFQDRYKSEVVQDDRYLLAALRYIHQNPVKAGLTRIIGGYKWSSYRDYVNIGESTGITDIEEVLPMFSPIATQRRDAFEAFMADSDESNDEFLDANINIEETLRLRVEKICGISTSAQFQALPTKDRDMNIRKLREAGISIRQIVRLTGVPFGIARKNGG
jgi:REP element-mobilizing transposase RayT